jgi:hypothetical protein
MRIAVLCVFAGILVILSGSAFGIQGGDSPRDVEVQGRVTCIDESREEIPCSEESTRFGFLTLTHEWYFFMTTDSRAKMFQDPRVRERELVVKGRLRPQSQIEITKVWSVKNGQRLDIYYFCAVCNIKAHVGGLCWCCQEDFELREEPIE